jgi:ketosteroid isomerase-like protein
MGPSRTGLVIGLFVFLGLVLVGTLVYYAACPPYAVRPKGVKVPPPVSRPLPPIPSVPDGSAVKPPPGEKGQPAPEPGIRPEQEERIRTDVEATVKNWLDAWRNGNVDTYMSFYAPDVLGETEVGRPPLNRGQWRIYKLGLFEKYHSIVIEVVGSIAVTVDPVKPNEAKVTYSQRFRGDSKYSDYGEKSLTLHCTNGEWRIVRESWRKLP